MINYNSTTSGLLPASYLAVAMTMPANCHPMLATSFPLSFPSFPRRRESIVNYVICHFCTVDSRLRGNDEVKTTVDSRFRVCNIIYTK